MNKLIKKMGVLFSAFLLLGCDPKSEANTQTPTNNSNNNGNGAETIKPIPSISPKEFFCKIAKIDKSTRYKRAVITYSITQTASGTTQKTLRNGNPLQEGTFQSSRVIEVAQDERGELTYFATKETKKLSNSR